MRTKSTNAISSTVSKTCLARAYPALDVVAADTDLVLAIVDDFSPVAVEERERGARLFFASAPMRDGAREALASRFAVSAVDVSDEDWARRSQENLQPVTVGNITIFPNPESLTTNPSGLGLVIRPSMGFGTGHHATTRLCLQALQAIDLSGKTVLDVGTGSGVLAIAAHRLGAASAIGIDVDSDAIQSANENLALNGEAPHVRFEVADLASTRLSPADVIVANLTGGLLLRSAATLREAAIPGGGLILSGLQMDEREAVIGAFAPVDVVWERIDDSWVGVMLKKT